jgi:hypothetical protein
MGQTMRYRILLICCLVAQLVAPASSYAAAALTPAALTPADKAAVQQTVRLQIDALAQDDADRAFALATPDTRDLLGTPVNFLQMIKQEYEPVYRHQLVLFSPPELIQGQVYQVVHLTDLDSRVWIAIYSVNRDEGGAWKVDGCQLIGTSLVAV